MKKVYLAGPFFTKGEILLGEEIFTALTDAGFEVHSPCREDMIHGFQSSSIERMDCFKSNMRAIEESNYLVGILDDEDPTTMWEICYGYTNGLPVYCFHSDIRLKIPNTILMSCSGIFSSFSELIKALNKDK